MQFTHCKINFHLPRLVTVKPVRVTVCALAGGAWNKLSERYKPVMQCAWCWKSPPNVPSECFHPLLKAVKGTLGCRNTPTTAVLFSPTGYVNCMGAVWNRWNAVSAIIPALARANAAILPWRKIGKPTPGKRWWSIGRNQPSSGKCIGKLWTEESLKLPLP